MKRLSKFKILSVYLFDFNSLILWLFQQLKTDCQIIQSYISSTQFKTEAYSALNDCWIRNDFLYIKYIQHNTSSTYNLMISCLMSCFPYFPISHRKELYYKVSNKSTTHHETESTFQWHNLMAYPLSEP